MLPRRYRGNHGKRTARVQTQRGACKKHHRYSSKQEFQQRQRHSHRCGVCQAYCELFYRLAEPLGIETRIISGKTKGAQIGSREHARLYVIVEDDGSGIFIDPTWGAGSVDNGVFIQKEDDMTWFDVSPEWLIFTHFPQNPAHQLLQVPVTLQQFDALPKLEPSMQTFGFDGAALLHHCLNGNTDLPQIFSKCIGLPLNGKLQVGKAYTFAIQPGYGLEWAICNEDKWFNSWKINPTTKVQQITITPVKRGNLEIGVKTKPGKRFNFIIEYEVE